MLVNEESVKTSIAWGVWETSPHVAMHLSSAYSTRRAALAMARELILRGWADEVVVRRMTLGKPIVLQASLSPTRKKTNET